MPSYLCGVIAAHLLLWNAASTASVLHALTSPCNSTPFWRSRYQDDIQPDDHKIKLDAEDLRETKRAKAAAGIPSGSGTAALTSGNTWSGYGSGGVGGGGAGAGGGGGASSSASPRPTGGVLGGMRMSVTKKEALRSKGVFKIAPQSKVRFVARAGEDTHENGAAILLLM